MWEWTGYFSLLSFIFSISVSNNRYLTCTPFRLSRCRRKRNRSGMSGSPGIWLNPLSAWARGPWPRLYWGWWWRPDPSRSALRVNTHDVLHHKQHQHTDNTESKDHPYLSCSVDASEHTRISCDPQSENINVWLRHILYYNNMQHS